MQSRCRPLYPTRLGGHAVGLFWPGGSRCVRMWATAPTGGSSPCCRLPAVASPPLPAVFGEDLLLSFLPALTDALSEGGLEGLPRTHDVRSHQGRRLHSGHGLHSFLLADPGPRPPALPQEAGPAGLAAREAPCPLQGWPPHFRGKTPGPTWAQRPPVGHHHHGAARLSRFFEHACLQRVPGCTRLLCQRCKLLVAVGLLGRWKAVNTSTRFQF